MIGTIAGYFALDTLLFRVIAFALAATLHDAVHAAVARLCGDNAAARAGRLSLNPIAHIDPYGLIMLLFGPYGWTKPMPVETERRIARILIYAAGPAASLMLGVFFWWLYFTVPAFVAETPIHSSLLVLAKGIVQYLIIVNLMLGCLNLLPLYPFDGWGVWKSFLKDNKLAAAAKYEKLGLIPVLILMISPPGQKLLEFVYHRCTQIVMNLFA